MDKPPLSLCAERILQNVIDAMQEAEELGGPEDDDYINLMQHIAERAQESIANLRQALGGTPG